jgi:hypothetical protein
MNEPHEIVFFTDRDLGHQFPEQLRRAGLKVERHDDHFDSLTNDPNWIGVVALTTRRPRADPRVTTRRRAVSFTLSPRLGLRVPSACA